MSWSPIKVPHHNLLTLKISIFRDILLTDKWESLNTLPLPAKRAMSGGWVPAGRVREAEADTANAGRLTSAWKQ